jgi:uncharacterized protein YprB with RNaseH-like and TPR domain
MDLHSLVAKVKELESELGQVPTRQELIASGVSDWCLRKIKFSEILKAAGLESIKYKKHQPDIPRVFLFDIETAPILAHVWGLFDQNVGLNQIERDWHLLSWAGKWLGEDEIFYFDQRNSKDLEDDSGILKELWKIMDQADVMIGHNSKKFDTKKVNARFIYHGLKPTSSFREVDTLTIAKRKFAFTSNKLAHLAAFLKCENNKSEHKKFVGFDLWTQCLKGNIEAFQEMELYNKMDVIVLEEVYKKLMPWDNSINYAIFQKDNICSCGSGDFFKNGYRFTNAGKFQRFRCNSCGRDVISKDNLIDPKIRKGLFK